MTKKFSFTGFFILGLLLLADPSSGHDPVFVNVGDGTANCFSYGSPYIGFADCNTTTTGGYGTLAVTQLPPDLDTPVQWNTDSLAGSLNYTVTSESSEFAGVPGICGTGNNFDWQPTFNGDSFTVLINTPGSCYYYCKFHPTSQMRGVAIAPGVGSTTTTSTTTTTRPVTTTTTTTLPNQPPSLNSLTPVNISTLPSVAQSFTAGYSDPNGYLNITDASLFLSGSTHNEWIHYNPQTNRFTMNGVVGNCSPGQATTLSNAYLTLNCNTSSASGSGTNLTVIYNLTPQPPLSGAAYRLIMAAVDQGGSNVNKDMGYWVVNRPPHADSVTPMNSSTPAGTAQTFTAVYSDLDGYQNIAEANFYLSSGGLHNEWLHYVAAANIFFIMGAGGVCTPGQATTLSNGYLTLNCATSSVSGSGAVLTVTFRVTPQAPSSGINYNIFTGVSDHAGAAHGLFAGTWQIQ